MATSVTRATRRGGHTHHYRQSVNLGAIAARPSEFRALAIEAQAELIAANDTDNKRDERIIALLNPNNARDRWLILELQYCIEQRKRRSAQVREDNARICKSAEAEVA